MKATNSTVKILAVVPCFAAGAFLASAQQSTPVNYDQVAIQKWYTNQVTTYPVGSGPSALTFDGENIWVVNSGDNTVTKLRAADGTNLGTFPVGKNPDAITFDGANIWVGNYADGSLTELRASDGKNLGTFTLGASYAGYPTWYYPKWLGFDGTAVWETGDSRLYDGGLYPNQFSTLKLSTTNAALLETSKNEIWNGLTFDGTSMVQVFVAAEGDNTGNVAVVSKLLPNILFANPIPVPDMTELQFNVAVGDWCQWGQMPAAADAANLWVTDSCGSGYMYKLRASDATVLATFPSTPAAGDFTLFDGTNVWSDGKSGNSVVKVRVSDGAVSTFTVGNSPAAMAFDGVHVWVANQGDNTVSKL